MTHQTALTGGFVKVKAEFASISDTQDAVATKLLMSQPNLMSQYMSQRKRMHQLLFRVEQMYNELNQGLANTPSNSEAQEQILMILEQIDIMKKLNNKATTTKMQRSINQTEIDRLAPERKRKNVSGHVGFGWKGGS